MTPKQTRFVQEYLKDLNATKAAIRAGYSEKTASIIGHENLRKPKIAAEIQKAQSASAKRNEITSDEVLKHIARIGLHKVDLSQVTPKDQLRALDLLGRHFGMFTDKVEHDHTHRLEKPLSPEDMANEYADAFHAAAARDAQAGG